MHNATAFTPVLSQHPTTVIDEISVYNREDYNAWFEIQYNSKAEPWNYSYRAAELYRYQYTIQQLQQYNANPQIILELGCSKGIMTEMMIPFAKTIYASDISLTAVKACKQRCEAKAKRTGCKMEYFVTTTPGLPFLDDSLDVVTVCDGLVGWWFSEEQKRLALMDVHRVLKKGGIAILTDYLPNVHNGGSKAYESLIENSPLTMVKMSNLYDKPWYKLESIVKKTGANNKLKGLLSSLPLAKMLNTFGRMIGPRAAHHIVIVVRKD
jgi:ubiquinone/menaquinone biosynthesis C-methylase UbiE